MSPGPRALRAGRQQADADPWPSIPRLGVGRAGSNRPTSDGSAEGRCHSKAEKLVIFLKKKKKKKKKTCNFFEKKKY